ncbi:hypothetical protein ES705_18307 [subsurface metagenome]
MPKINEIETDKEMLLRHKAYEEKGNIVKNIIKTLKNWKKLSPKERIAFTEQTPFKISALDKTTQRTIIKELVISGIFKKRELQKEVDLSNTLFEREEPEEKKEKKTGIRTLIPGLIHLIKENGKVGYLLQREENLYIDETFTGEDGITYKPKGDLPIHYCGVDILEESREVDYIFLLKDIIRFIKKYLELPDENNYLILALWIFHTYMIERFDITPLIYFSGVYETGKTRAGEVLGELAYKCERMTSPTEATLFRSADYFKNTLVIDEIRLWGPNGNEEVARLIMSRYKRGLKVSRVNLNKKGEDQIEYFDVFAPLVISTTETIPPAIKSRCINFIMQKNRNPDVEGPIDSKTARDIRNKLTIFRANCLYQEFKEIDPISRRRLNEILMPLYQVLMEVAPDLEDEFRLTVKGLEQDREIEEEFTIEAEIVEAIAEYYNKARETAFSTAEITNQLNRDRSEKDKFSSRFIGRRLVILGFKQKRLKNNKKGFNFELGFLEKLITQYKVKNINPEQTLFDN